MKTSILLVLVLLPLLTFAQTGGVVLSFSFEDEETILPKPVLVEIWQDTTLLRNDTVQGFSILRDLPVGTLFLSCSYEGSYFLQKDRLNIQAKQLVYSSFYIDTNVHAQVDNAPALLLRHKRSGNRHDFIPSVDAVSSARNNPSVIITREDIARLPVNSLDLESVMIVSYKTPLINYDGASSSYVISRDDVARMPTRTVSGIVSTVGGVNVMENSDMHIRGARSDANAYYIDGVRVRSSNGIPRSSIEQITVYPGGIPAKYGDVTGGVIAVDTKSALHYNQPSYPASSGNNSRINKKFNYSSTASQQQLTQEHFVEPKLSVDRFTEICENDFLSPLEHPNSTFGIDVDQASWTYIKECYKQRATIDRDAVKLEEMINSFKQKEVKIEENELIGVEIDRGACSWNPNNELVTIRLNAMDLPKDTPRISHNIVLLVDVSGSMSSSNKLPLLIAGLNEFVGSLCENDVISIVTYAGSSGVVLGPTKCSEQSTILSAISSLASGGGTNGIEGISTAYELAEKHFNPDKNNRIILATDGDFNIGAHSPNEMTAYIATKRGQGIYITVLGFGMGNYRSDILEEIADNGDGNHFFINNMSQCRKVLMEDLGNLINIARDVKLNVEFNPRLVKEYRLIGYENRLMTSRDFDDDTKDGGEMGYSHAVTAVYEITRGKDTKEKNHFVKTTTIFDTEELAFVKLRYKPMEDSASIERKFSLKEKDEMKEDQLINLIVSFGLYMRNSAFKGTLTKETIIAQANAFVPSNKDERELKGIILSLEKGKE